MHRSLKVKLCQISKHISSFHAQIIMHKSSKMELLHTLAAVLMMSLKITLEKNILSVLTAPRSPDLNPYDFSLWGV